MCTKNYNVHQANVVRFRLILLELVHGAGPLLLTCVPGYRLLTTEYWCSVDLPTDLRIQAGCGPSIIDLWTMDYRLFTIPIFLH